MNDQNETQSPRRSSKAWLIVLAVVVIVLVLPASVYGLLAYRFWSNKPQLKHNYAAELNAPIEKIPLADRAWPHLRAALTKLKPGLERWKPEEFSLDSPSWPQVMAFVGEYQAALAELRQAAKLPRLGYIYTDSIHPEDLKLFASGPTAPDELPEPPSANPVLLQVNLVPQQWLREATPLLIADARRAAAAGDGAAVAVDIAAVADIARHMQDPPSAVALRASWETFVPCCETIGEILLSHPQALSKAQLIDIAATFKTFPRTA